MSRVAANYIAKLAHSIRGMSTCNEPCAVKRVITKIASVSFMILGALTRMIANMFCPCLGTQAVSVEGVCFRSCGLPGQFRTNGL